MMNEEDLLSLSTSSTISDLYRHLQSHPEYKKKKNYDHISYRVLFIKSMMANQEVTPLINISLTEPQQDGGERVSKDMRTVVAKKAIDFNDLMHSLGCKLLYVKSGSTGHTFRGIMPVMMGGGGEPFTGSTSATTGQPHFNVGVKVVAYPKKGKYGSVHACSRPENAEIMMLRVLADLVVNNHTPPIVLPIATFNSSIRPFINLSSQKIVTNKRFDEFVERYKKGEMHSTVSVLMSEWANGGDLLDYFRKNYTSMKLIHWKVIFFQIISALAVIFKKYPDFRHNDLKANNILVHKIEAHRKNRHKYVINGKRYCVPNVGVQVKLWDFDFACIPSLVDNAKVDAKWTDRINVRPQRNQYYDLHYFFNTLCKKGFFPEIITSPSVPSQVGDFLRRVVPDKYSQHSGGTTLKGRLLVDDEYITPEKLLDDEFFASLLVVVAIPPTQKK
jgi:hypothetical protein